MKNARTMSGAIALALFLAVLPDHAIADQAAQQDLPDCSMVDPADNTINLACNIYWEARGEPISSKVSVAILTVNRVENAHYKHSVHSVVWERQPGPQFSWTEDGKSDKVSENEQQAWQESIWVARLVWDAFNDPDFDIQVGDVDLKTATHYHSDYVHPSWAQKMVYLGTVGRHLFYCAPRVMECSSTG